MDYENNRFVAVLGFVAFRGIDYEKNQIGEESIAILGMK
jgi:hypothetical protein